MVTRSACPRRQAYLYHGLFPAGTPGTEAGRQCATLGRQGLTDSRHHIWHIVFILNPAIARGCRVQLL